MRPGHSGNIDLLQIRVGWGQESRTHPGFELHHRERENGDTSGHLESRAPPTDDRPDGEYENHGTTPRTRVVHVVPGHREQDAPQIAYDPMANAEPDVW